MSDGHYNNALAEMALALAMAFFSVMVLAMISMGAGGQGKQAAPLGEIRGIAVRPAVAAKSSTEQPPPTRDTIVLYHGGWFYDTKLKRIDPSGIRTKGRVVLAIDPNLPVAQAIDARTRIVAGNLVVTTFDQHWQRKFKEMAK